MARSNRGCGSSRWRGVEVEVAEKEASGAVRQKHWMGSSVGQAAIVGGGKKNSTLPSKYF